LFLYNIIVLCHFVFSCLIDVLLVVSTIVAAYCQETTKAKRTRSQTQQTGKKTEKKTKATKALLFDTLWSFLGLKL
jgi:hypothetical protein